MGRHHLRKDRTNLYRAFLLTTATVIVATNVPLLIPESQAIPSMSTISPPSPVLAQPSPVSIPSAIPPTTTSPTTTVSLPEPTSSPPKTTVPPPPTTTKPPPPPSAPQKEEEEKCSTKLAGTKPHVAEAGRHIMAQFGILESVIGGLGSRSRTSDHPSGHALDFSVNRVTGDQVAEYALENMKLLSVKYVIWRQRINYGSGWQRMEDRGSATANHYDHVHISFNRTKTGNPEC